MASDKRDGGTDFESLARQYWNGWGELMRGGETRGASAAGLQGWNDAIDWWSKLAHGGRGEVNDAVERFNAQARDWFGGMQQVAARFAGQGAGAADIAAEWKRALGAMGENPFPEMMRAMRGQGLQGIDQWMDDASPYLDAWRREGAKWLGMPAFGIGREHQQRLQALARDMLDYRQAESAYNALMAKALQNALVRFEDMLVEHEEPGRELASARALFDLWIDAAEEAYAEVALSPEFRHAYGALANAQMRVRQGVQREVEQAGALLGMPTRTEVDAAHRKIAGLERELRRLRDALDARPGETSARASSPGKPSPAKPGPKARNAARKPAAKAETQPRKPASAKRKPTAKAARKPAKKGR